ncbi:hypothetical protein E2C01_019827 [Portunus trituberculatus]|uniref:Uncharacterized protein n=1 Tax=Portunus trituberculatus TaxID=210409 RepID=A0A5B7DYP3_PORTR|nr:hypothetical protein [Portunus trituberculatus]
MPSAMSLEVMKLQTNVDRTRSIHQANDGSRWIAQPTAKEMLRLISGLTNHFQQSLSLVIKRCHDWRTRRPTSKSCVRANRMKL